MRRSPALLINTAEIELWPGGLLRARGSADARALARAQWVLRRKRDGRYLAVATADGVLPLVPRLMREPGIEEALDALDLSAVSYQIVLTKADKLKAGEAEKVQAATLKAIAKRPAAYPHVAVTSSEKGLGLPELRAEIMRTTGVVLD